MSGDDHFLKPDNNELMSGRRKDSVWAMHSALSAADLEYSGYSCNGVNLFGDSKSIKAAADAFHYAAQVDGLKTQLRHWREECGKLHATIASLRTGVAE